MKKILAVLLAPAMLFKCAVTTASEPVVVHNIEYPSRLYEEGAAVITVESSSYNVRCIAYKDGVPVGSGEGFTTAKIANVTVLMSEKSGKLTVKCM